MRIIAGQFKGRTLATPKGHTVRPTSDKIRGAIFNMLESRGTIQNVSVLDVFCGTGALGLEALSRGASSCIFIDKDRKPLALTQKNIETFRLDNCTQLIKKDALSLGPKPTHTAPVNLVFLDPPYGKNYITRTLKNLHANNWLTSAGTLCVVEAEKTWQPNVPPPYRILDERLYGDTKILLLSYERTPV